MCEKTVLAPTFGSPVHIIQVSYNSLF